MNPNSYNISISFKSDIALLGLIDRTCQTHYISRSQLIRNGVILMINKLGNTNTSITSDTDKMDVTSVIESPVTQTTTTVDDTDQPNTDRFKSSSPIMQPSSPATVDELDTMFPPSIYGWS